MIFFVCQRVWKTAKCQGKIREKSGNFEVDDKWQPCLNPGIILFMYLKFSEFQTFHK